MPHGRLDAIDQKILATLQEDGRLANVELAARVGLSPSACLRRVNVLESEGYIEGYTARLSPRKLGLGVLAFAQVQVAQDSESATATFTGTVGAMPEVLACYATAGAFDYMLKIVASDLDAYENLVMKRLLKVSGVREVRSTFVLEPVKEVTGLPILGLAPKD